TINGKLDRKALPEPDVTSAENYVAPENDTERAICEIFGTVLGLEIANIGADDDFFKMGGDSISSIQLVNRIRQTFSVQISVKDIFAAKTVRRLSELVERQKGNRSSVISEQGLLGGEVMLSPIQEWFFDIKAKGMIPAYNHWNQSFLINVPLLDMDRLKLSIDKLLEYHDALRMGYTIGTEGYGQAYDTSVSEYTIRRLDVSQYADERQVAEILTAWQSELDIFNGKVFTVGYLSGYTDGNAKLFFAFHHLVIDTVSWRIIKDDLEKIYFYYADNPQDDTASAEKILGGKATSYRQWTERIIKNYPETYSDEKEYWDKMTSGIADTNKILEGIKRDEYVFTTISFDEEKTEKLLRDINGVYNTGMNDLLLTALAASLPVVTGNKQNHILLEGHGREELWENVDISNTAGWFTSMYPVRIDASDGELASRIISMKELLRGIPRNGIGYGALMGYISRELPRISFNYLGQFNSSEQGLWSITTNEYVNDVSPLNRDTNIININGGIFDNRLSFSFAGYISQAMIDMLAISFQNALTEIIEYLCSCTRSYLTPSDVRGIISAGYLNRLQSEKEVDDIYLANSLQQGFIYHAINQGDVDDAYRVQLSWEYHNVLNVELLKKSWELTQQKYETMRLRFAWEEELVQVIDKVGNLDWNYMEVEGLGQDARDKYLAELTAKDREHSFDLKEGSLFRIYLIRFEHDHYGFLFSNHHAILDGWSMPVLLNNVHETYIRLLKGEVLKSCSDLSYGNSQQYLQEHRFANVDYWKEQVRMVESHEDLDSLLKPELRSQVILSDYKHIREPQEESIVIEGEELKKMKSVCSHYGFTVNALLQYCWHKQLSIYGATEITVVGTVVSGRNIPVDGIEQSVGLYINTLPVILEHKDRPVVELIKSVQDKINEVNSRSDVGLASLQKEGKRLFNTLFVYENYPVPENREIDETLKYEFKES
ncbi:condensation domain-containing protein, partial [Porphyromonas gingivalis]|uniref:condensation domain-containing protein n=1 Tax=Porphyromonas gingivalis TaxID=837 RepID=UPI001C4DF01B